MALQKTPTFSQKTSHIVRPSNRASFWKQSIVGSCLAILGLGSSVTHAESIDTTHFAAPKNSMKKFCNQGYIERAGKIYEVSA